MRREGDGSLSNEKHRMARNRTYTVTTKGKRTRKGKYVGRSGPSPTSWLVLDQLRFDIIPSTPFNFSGFSHSDSCHFFSLCGKAPSHHGLHNNTPLFIYVPCYGGLRPQATTIHEGRILCTPYLYHQHRTRSFFGFPTRFSLTHSHRIKVSLKSLLAPTYE